MIFVSKSSHMRAECEVSPISFSLSLFYKRHTSGVWLLSLLEEEEKNDKIFFYDNHVNFLVPITAHIVKAKSSIIHRDAE